MSAFYDNSTDKITVGSFTLPAAEGSVALEFYPESGWKTSGAWHDFFIDIGDANKIIEVFKYTDNVIYLTYSWNLAAGPGTGYVQASGAVTSVTEGTRNTLVAQWKVSPPRLEIFLNGVSIGSSTSALTLISFNTPDLTIGHNPGVANSSINGKLSNVLVRNTVLSQQEITDFQNYRTIPVGTSNHWPLKANFNDAIGSAHGTNSGTVLTIDEAVILGPTKRFQTLRRLAGNAINTLSLASGLEVVVTSGADTTSRVLGSRSVKSQLVKLILDHISTYGVLDKTELVVSLA